MDESSGHTALRADAVTLVSVQPPAERAEPPAVAATVQDNTSIEELKAAVQAEQVTLDHLISAYYLSRCPYNSDADSRQKFVKLFPELTAAYAKTHGGEIIDVYFAKHIRAAAVLAGDYDMHIRYPPEAVVNVSPEFEEAIWRCSSLCRQGKQYLTASGRRALVGMLHSLMVYLLGVLDSQTAAADDSRLSSADREERTRQAIETADAELTQAEVFIENTARANALRLYLLGMPVGLVLLALAAVLLAWTGIPNTREDLFLGSLVAGGLGAMVSVMARLTSGRLTVNYQTGVVLKMVPGLFRPLIGAVFGLALYVMIVATLIPLSTPTDGTQRQYYYWAIAFLAGFSERLAQDVLTTTAASVTPGGRAPKESAPAQAAPGHKSTVAGRT